MITVVAAMAMLWFLNATLVTSVLPLPENPTRTHRFLVCLLALMAFPCATAALIK